MSESETVEGVDHIERLMSLKEVVEQFSKYRIAGANGPNRRFLLSYLRTGKIVATGLVKLPLDLTIDIPRLFWNEFDNLDFKNVTSFLINFKTLMPYLAAETISKIRDQITQLERFKKIEGEVLEKKIRLVEIEININLHEWLRFKALPEIMEIIKTNKKLRSDNFNIDEELSEEDAEMDNKWELAYQLLIRAIMDYGNVYNIPKFSNFGIITRYEDIVKEIQLQPNAKKKDFLGDSSIRNKLSAILKAELKDFAKGKPVEYTPETKQNR
jgi:hypothetical protein